MTLQQKRKQTGLIYKLGVVNIRLIINLSSNILMANTRGVLRFGLVGDVPPAAQDPYLCSGKNFATKSWQIFNIFRIGNPGKF